MNNPISGDKVKDTRDGRRVPRDEIQGRRLSKACLFAWFNAQMAIADKTISTSFSFPYASSPLLVPESAVSSGRQSLARDSSDV